MQRKEPTRLTAITFSNMSIGWGSPREVVLATGAIPAQFTRMRSGPWASRAFEKPASTLA